jgi:hypothetical protein
MIKILKSNKNYLLLIFFTIAIFFAPFLVKPTLLTQKDNDLGRSSIPHYTFFAQSVLVYKQLPLWNPNQMMGETFVGNPVSSLFYPGNIIFLLLPIDIAAVLYLFLHVLLAAYSTYFLARAKKLNMPSSFAAAIFYGLSIKMLMHISAGHITIISAMSYFPLLVLFVYKLWQSTSFKWIVASAITLTLIYFNFPTIALYSFVFVLLLCVYQIVIAKNNLKEKKALGKKLIAFLLFFMVFLGLAAIYFFPQMELRGLSTRADLKLTDVAVPIWNQQKFFQSLTFPYLILNDLDQESLLYLGLIPTILALVGFWFLPRISKIAVAAIGAVTLVFVAGTSTPFFGILYKTFPLLTLMRVTTRLWFAVALVVALLAALAISKIKNRKIVLVLVVIYLVEAFFIGFTRINSIADLDFKKAEIYQALAGSPGEYRVYCTTYCFNPQQLPRYNIELLNGETPIQQKSFVQFLALAGNYNFANFAVIFPPYQIWQVNNPPVPNLDLLSKANVKYVASTYKIDRSQLTYVSKFGKVYLYRNENAKNRAYFQEDNEPVELKYYSPNIITFKFSAKNYGRTLIIAQNYFPGWVYYNDNKKHDVAKHEDVFVEIKVAPKSQEAILKYEPQSYITGKTITFGTIVLLLLLIFKNK